MRGTANTRSNLAEYIIFINLGTRHVDLELDRKPLLTVVQKPFKLIQHEGTESPIKTEFCDNKKKGIYGDIVSGESLLNSTDKIRFGNGWKNYTSLWSRATL